MTFSKDRTVRATIIAGFEDGLAPGPSTDISKECRILYMAMARAKESLFGTWATRRRGACAEQECVLSRVTRIDQSVKTPLE